MDVFTWGNLWPGALLIGLLLLLIFHKPIKWLLKVLLRSALSLVFLIVWGASGLLPSLALGANVFNALTLGLLGIPGFGLLLLFRWLSLA
ncbi:MAG: transcriptional regulator [Firmicutes bacterium]|nr:transcriptional regulator [Bacillota bacterium]